MVLGALALCISVRHIGVGGVHHVHESSLHIAFLAIWELVIVKKICHVPMDIRYTYTVNVLLTDLSIFNQTYERTPMASRAVTIDSSVVMYVISEYAFSVINFEAAFSSPSRNKHTSSPPSWNEEKEDNNDTSSCSPLLLTSLPLIRKALIRACRKMAKASRSPSHSSFNKILNFVLCLLLYCITLARASTLLFAFITLISRVYLVIRLRASLHILTRSHHRSEGQSTFVSLTRVLVWTFETNRQGIKKIHI